LLFCLLSVALAHVDEDSELILAPTDSFDGLKYGLFLGFNGDINNDGFDDLLVAAQSDSSVAPANGAVYVYYGSATGIDPASVDKIIPPLADVIDFFGAYATGNTGDLNGDGFDDLAVGMYGHDVGGVQGGYAYTFDGSPAGVDLGSEFGFNSTGQANWSLFGGPMTGRSDFNNDGFDDLVVGRAWEPASTELTGWVHVFLGSAAGIDLTTEQQVFPSDNTGNPQRFGEALASGGDFDGDGFDDLVVGSFNDDANGPTSGSVYIYYGSASGLDVSREQKLLASSSLSDDAYGEKVAIGDFDGDGFDDLVVGAPKRDRNRGVVYLYKGTNLGIDPGTVEIIAPSDPQNNAFYGSWVSAGDMDGDGEDELAIAAAADSVPGVNRGSIYIYGWDGRPIRSGAERKITPSNPADEDQFGISLDISGDVNGDGMNDLVVGAWGVDSGGLNNVGAAYVYLSEVTPPSEIPFLGPLPLALLGLALGGAGVSLTRREDEV
jgi:hypothetical protein